jgi:branched-subunit amino acid ABC-type transport system permease component
LAFYRVINLAHGQLIMLGGFATYVVTTQLGLNFSSAFFAAMVVMGLLGIALEATVCIL